MLKPCEARIARDGAGVVWLPDDTHAGRVAGRLRNHRAACACGFRGAPRAFRFQAFDDLRAHQAGNFADAEHPRHDARLDPGYLRDYTVTV